MSARKTHCPRGHPLTDDNVAITTRSNGRVSRACKTCLRRREGVRRAKTVRYYRLPTME